MILAVFSILFLQLQSHLSFLFPLSLQSISILLQLLYRRLQSPFVVGLIRKLLVVGCFYVVHFLLVISYYGLYQHFVISFAASFKQDGEHSPKRSHILGFGVSVFHALLKELVKANAVHKQSSVDAITCLLVHT